jgi:hypothetical protein
VTPQARVEHLSPGRLRLRVAGQRGRAAYFEMVRARLGQEPAVRAVQVNARTGSVLLYLHEPVNWPALLARAAQLDLFRLVPAPAPEATKRRVPAPQVLGRLAEPGTTGSAVLALALLAGAAVQGWRGQIAAPAVTLVWYAMQLLRGADKGGA